MWRTPGGCPPPPLQLVAALAVGDAVSLLCFAVAPLMLPTGSRIAQVIGTLAVLILLQAGARYLFTDTPLRAEVWMFGDRNVDLFGTTVPVNSLMILSVTV